MAEILAFNRQFQKQESIDELHTQLVQWVEDSEIYFNDANKRASRDRNYYDGRQWSDEDAQEREDLGRSVICVNRIARKVRFMKGFEAGNRTSAKALPRTPAHTQTADVVTEGLRYIADKGRLDQTFSRCFEFLIIEGIEAVEVGATQQTDGSVDPEVNLISWDRFLYDPYCREQDFSDALYLGMESWMDLDEAIDKWPEKADILESGLHDYPTTLTYDDSPQWIFSTGNRKRIRFVQLYFKVNGEWNTAIFTKSAYIQEPQPSGYVDEYGKPDCPIIAACALVNSDNERYGFVREMIDVQDEINVRHSNDIDFSKMRQTVGEKGAVADVNESKRELQKPNGHVEITRGLRFDVLPTNDLAQRNLEALTLAKQEIELMGPNAAMLGKDNRAPSGRAIMISQEGGTYELSPFMDCHKDFKTRVYRAIWSRIKQFWNGEKWIRITDDSNKLQWVGINVPVTYGQMIAQQNGGQIPPEIQLRYGPMLNQVAKVENEISYLDMDIVIDQVSHSAVVQQEQFDNLIDLAKIAGSMGQQIPFSSIIQASAIRDKDKIIEEMKQAQEGNKQAQAQQAELLAQKIAAEIESNLAAARQKDADALVKTIQAQLQGLQAQTYGLLTPPVTLPPALQPPMQPGMMPGQPNSPTPGMEGQEPSMMGDMQGAGPMIQSLPPGVNTGVE